MSHLVKPVPVYNRDGEHLGVVEGNLRAALRRQAVARRKRAQLADYTAASVAGCRRQLLTERLIEGFDGWSFRSSQRSWKKYRKGERQYKPH